MRPCPATCNVRGTALRPVSALQRRRLRRCQPSPPRSAMSEHRPARQTARRRSRAIRRGRRRPPNKRRRPSYGPDARRVARRGGPPGRRAARPADAARRRRGRGSPRSARRAKIPFRPGREAEIVRRLLARHHGPLPRRVLPRLWRELFAGHHRHAKPLRHHRLRTGPAWRLRDPCARAFRRD